MTSGEPEVIASVAIVQSNAESISNLLEEMRLHAVRESGRQARRERAWSWLGVVLGFGGAFGAGVGGVSAIKGTSSVTAQLMVVVIAFVGAALSAAAGTLRAPEKAEDAKTTKIQLRAYASRIRTIIHVDLESTDDEGRREILEAAQRSLEEIDGASLPTHLKVTNHPHLLGRLNADSTKKLLPEDVF